VGENPALVSTEERNIEKQPACAAPTNSSGFVPLPVAKREAWVKGPSNAPSPTFMVPAPSFNVPFHSADDVRTAMVSSLSKLISILFYLE
jgi:hypothetical protein